jgi:hypothetical protein
LAQEFLSANINLMKLKENTEFHLAWRCNLAAEHNLSPLYKVGQLFIQNY